MGNAAVGQVLAHGDALRLAADAGQQRHAEAGSYAGQNPFEGRRGGGHFDAATFQCEQAQGAFAKSAGFLEGDQWKWSPVSGVQSGRGVPLER